MPGSPETSSRHVQKQSKVNTYWLGKPVPTSNSFFLLDNDEKPDANSEPKDRSKKPAPIFVDGVSNIQPLISLLNEHAKGHYEIKILRNEQVKVQPKSSEAYSKIVKQLEIKQTEFYTYKQKQDRGFKVVLKNMHSSTDTNEIKMTLSDLFFSLWKPS